MKFTSIEAEFLVVIIFEKNYLIKVITPITAFTWILLTLFTIQTTNT